MTLNERIEEAMRRIAKTPCLFQQDQSDPDLVLEDCRAKIEQLEASLSSVMKEREKDAIVRADLLAALIEMAVFHGAVHEGDCPGDEGECPGDDTCECKYKPFNDRVNGAASRAESRAPESSAPTNLAPVGGNVAVIDSRPRIAQLCDEVESLRASLKVAVEALTKLANEASGFLSMAVKDTHGYTNIRILHDRIIEAREALSTIKAQQDSGKELEKLLPPTGVSLSKCERKEI